VAEILGDWEALIAEIRRRAQHRALEREEDATKRSAAILADASQRRAAIEGQLEQAGDLQCAALIRRNRAKGELEARRHFAILREQPIDQVWRETEARLRALVTQPEYQELLQGLAKFAARELGSPVGLLAPSAGAREFVLAADPTGHALLTPEILEQWSKKAQVLFVRARNPAATWGGLLVTSGRNRFDATFPTRLAEAQRTLRERVFEVLTNVLTENQP
jgi:vacuolar-type H+-ATPase subunit E/Vma4